MTASRLSIQGNSIQAMLIVRPSLDTALLLAATEDNSIQLRLPRTVAPWAVPDDHLVITLGVTKVSVEPELDPEPRSTLILPGRH